jgi:hypothetical protein
VAQHGKAIWVVRVPPDRLSKLNGGLWYVYGLETHSREAVLEDLRLRFPPQPRMDGIDTP